jgi:hypothetical protein
MTVSENAYQGYEAQHGAGQAQGVRQRRVPIPECSECSALAQLIPRQEMLTSSQQMGYRHSGEKPMGQQGLVAHLEQHSQQQLEGHQLREVLKHSQMR